MAPQPSNATTNSSRTPQPRQLPINAPSQTRKPHKSRTRWHFGIRSKCPAWEVMLEIYRSLQNVGMVKYQFATIDLLAHYPPFFVGMENA
jgi:carbon catabolite-derepressing protein kinase